jgi:hypothetical protein
MGPELEKYEKQSVQYAPLVLNGGYYVHPTAIVEEGAVLGNGAKV